MSFPQKKDVPCVLSSRSQNAVAGCLQFYRELKCTRLAFDKISDSNLWSMSVPSGSSYRLMTLHRWNRELRNLAIDVCGRHPGYTTPKNVANTSFKLISARHEIDFLQAKMVAKWNWESTWYKVTHTFLYIFLFLSFFSGTENLCFSAFTFLYNLRKNT